MIRIFKKLPIYASFPVSSHDFHIQVSAIFFFFEILLALDKQQNDELPPPTGMECGTK